MSRVVIQGNASGTGDFTIAAPNSNTDRTLTLPDHAGTVLASATITVDETNGRLGFGTSSPNNPLHIVTTNKLGGTFTGTTAGEGLRVSQSNYTADNYVSLIEADYQAGGVPNVRIAAQFDGSGSSLVFGTTNNYASGITKTAMALINTGQAIFGGNDTYGVGSADSFIFNQGADWRAYSSRNSTSSAGHIAFYNPNGGVGSITTNGSATLYNTSSDYRLKENVTPITDGINRVKQLDPSRFNFIADATKTVDGFLAHDVQDVVPEAVTGDKDAVDSEGNPEYQGIDQAKLVPLLTAALKECISKIEDLETRVATLEG